MDIKTLASNLANRVNQEHYIEHELKKVYLQGFKDSKAKEMLKMLKDILDSNQLDEHFLCMEIEKLIEEATKID